MYCLSFSQHFYCFTSTKKIFGGGNESDMRFVHEGLWSWTTYYFYPIDVTENWIPNNSSYPRILWQPLRSACLFACSSCEEVMFLYGSIKSSVVQLQTSRFLLVVSLVLLAETGWRKSTSEVKLQCKGHLSRPDMPSSRKLIWEQLRISSYWTT